MIRLLIVLGTVALLYFFLKSIIGTSDFKNCGKCNGKGYWIATRGERSKCDFCNGAGKILK